MKSSMDATPYLRSLKTKLDAVHYDQIQMNLRGTQYFIYPWPIFQDFTNEIQKLPNYLTCLYNLLLLGKAVPLKTVEATLSRDLTDGLINVGLIKHDGALNVYLGGRSIPSRSGYYFIADLPKEYPTCNKRRTTVYLAQDSYSLAQHLAIPQDSYLLDLCTGTGVQAILSSARTRRSVGVELEKDASTIATYNTILNNVDDKVEIKRGDLYYPIEDERFDFICSNPPYMPVPPGVEFNGYGDGGRDGLEVINKILAELDNHLVDGGEAVISGWGLGKENHPFISNRLEELSEKNRWNITLLLTSKSYLSYQAYKIANAALMMNEMRRDEMVDRWKKLFLELNAEYGYSFIIFIQKINYAQYKIIRSLNPWVVKDKPRLSDELNFEKAEFYNIRLHRNDVRVNTDKVMTINKKVFTILKLCDGHRTIEEVVRKYISTLDLGTNEYSSSYYLAQTLNEVLKLFTSLEKKGMIKRINHEQRSIDEKTGFNLVKKVKKALGSH